MIEYVIESTLCLLVFYLIFAIFFKQSRHFQLQRITLVTAILYSILVPLLHIPSSLALPEISNEESVIENLTQSNPFTIADSTFKHTQNSLPDLPTLLFLAYIIGTVIFLVRFVVHLCLIVWKGLKSEKVEYQGIILSVINEPISPFTFFHFIFVSRSDYQSGKLDKALIYHELAHKNQYHSLDILLLEIIQIFFWFNPLIYLFKDLIKTNHEYLADEFVLTSGISCNDYSHRLFNATIKMKSSNLKSAFHRTSIKNRLIMLSKSHQKKPKASRMFLFIPLTIILFLTTAFQNTYRTSLAAGSYQEKGFFYADTIIWLEESRAIHLKGSMRVKFLANDFTAEGGYTGFGEIHLLIFDGQKVSPGIPIEISGMRCEIFKLTVDEAIKKYGKEGEQGAVEIYTSEK